MLKETLIHSGMKTPSGNDGLIKRHLGGGFLGRAPGHIPYMSAVGLLADLPNERPWSAFGGRADGGRAGGQRQQMTHRDILRRRETTAASEVK